MHTMHQAPHVNPVLMKTGAAFGDLEGRQRAIRALPMFQQRSLADIRPLARAGREFRLAARRPIYRQGETCSAVYVLNEGGVKLERCEGTGPRQVVGLVEPPAMIGETGLHSSAGYLVSATTFRPSLLLEIPSAAFLDWLRTRPALYECVLDELNRNLEDVISTGYVRATLTAEQRVAAYLLHRARDFEAGAVVVDRALSRRDIANLLGLAPETLSRVLHAFRERNLIAVREGCIAVQSSDALAEIVP